MRFYQLIRKGIKEVENTEMELYSIQHTLMYSSGWKLNLFVSNSTEEPVKWQTSIRTQLAILALTLTSVWLKLQTHFDTM